jgi:hypothetical protein
MKASGDHKAEKSVFFVALAGIGQPVGFIRRQGFPLILVAHTPSISKIEF